MKEWANGQLRGFSNEIRERGNIRKEIEANMHVACIIYKEGAR